MIIVSGNVKNINKRHRLSKKAFTFDIFISHFNKQKIVKECSNNHTLEAAVRRWSTKYVFLNILQNSQGKACARVLFFNKVAG